MFGIKFRMLSAGIPAASTATTKTSITTTTNRTTLTATTSTTSTTTTSTTTTSTTFSTTTTTTVHPKGNYNAKMISFYKIATYDSNLKSCLVKNISFCDIFL